MTEIIVNTTPINVTIAETSTPLDVNIVAAPVVQAIDITASLTTLSQTVNVTTTPIHVDITANIGAGGGSGNGYFPGGW